MLVKLALGNVRKTAYDYLIYFVTISFSVALLYAFNTIGGQVDMLPHRRLAIQTIDELMNILSYVLIVGLALLIIYANNYLIRRRSKEFALYQIFGMRRRAVAVILTIETFVSSLVALVVGLALGVLLSQFLVFVTGRVMREKVTNYHFVFNSSAAALTITDFGIIFLITLALNLITLRRFKLIDLVKRTQVNDVSLLNSPWVVVTLFAGGVSLIGYSYWRLIHSGYPFFTIAFAEDAEEILNAWRNFGLTTTLVCIGTYLFFYSLGGIFLYFARVAPAMYWRGLTMFTVREFASQIRRVTLSMGTISIILFLMLSIITPAFGVSMSVNRSIESNAPYAATFSMVHNDGLVDNGSSDADDARARSAGWNGKSSLEELRGVLEEKNIVTDISLGDDGVYQCRHMGEKARMTLTPTVSVGYFRDDGTPVDIGHPVPSFADYVKASGYDTSQWGRDFFEEFLKSSDFSSFDIASISSYNARRALNGLEPMVVNDGEYAVSMRFDFDGLRDMYIHALGSGVEVSVAGQALKPAGDFSVAFDESTASIFVENVSPDNYGLLVVPDSVFDAIAQMDNAFVEVYGALYFEGQQQDLHSDNDLSTYFFEPFSDDGEATADAEQSPWYIGVANTQGEIVSYTMEFLGVIIYVSLYVGFMLAMMSAAMLTIQILSRFNDAAARYRRLSQLGVSRRQENRSIAMQVALYFLLPLAMAACHAWVAVAQALDFIEFIMPMSIGLGVAITALLVVGIYGVYALLSYWTAKSIVSSEADLIER